MRSLVTFAVVLSFAMPLARPVDAQTRLPRKSPAERKTDQINRNLRQEELLLRSEQQYQFENNQIRQGIDRQQLFTRPSSPARINNCPPGSIGC